MLFDIPQLQRDMKAAAMLLRYMLANGMPVTGRRDRDQQRNRQSDLERDKMQRLVANRAARRFLLIRIVLARQLHRSAAAGAPSVPDAPAGGPGFCHGSRAAVRRPRLSTPSDKTTRQSKLRLPLLSPNAMTHSRCASVSGTSMPRAILINRNASSALKPEQMRTPAAIRDDRPIPARQ